MDIKARQEWKEGTGYRTSKYKGKCQWCGEYYFPLDKVNWNPRVRGTVCHAGCYSYYGSPSPYGYRGVS